MKVSVVIPALDEAGRIEAAIHSARMGRARSRAPSARPEPTLEPNSEPIDDVEVLVVDGGSRDDTVARAEAAGALVIRGERGRARQLRAGVAAAAGDAVLMLHADTRLPDGWKEAVDDALAAPDVAAGAFGLRFDEPARSLRAVEWGARVRSEWWQLPYGDQALFTRRSALEAVGGIPLAPVMEDVDLVQALKRQGRIVLLPLAVSTSGRRYLERGTARTVALHFVAVMARAFGVDRTRIARWLGR